jgi:hypothetical protein
MRFSPTEADTQSMKVIELLINSGHYKAFRKEDVIKTIGRDANLLSYALTEPGKGEEPRVQFERAKPERTPAGD